MKDFSLLFTALCKQSFRFDRSKQTGKTKWYIFAVYGLLVLVCLPLLGLVAYVIYQLGALAASADAVPGFLTCIFSAIQLVVLLFGIATVLNTIYFSKDNEMLLSYPVKPQTVFAVKLTFAYVLELITNFVLSLFAVIPFAIGAGMPFSLGLVFSFFLVPVLPLLIATILAIPLMYVISYLKNKSVVSTVALLVLVTLLFVAYFLVINSISMAEESTDIEGIILAMVGQINAIADIMLPNKFLALSMVGGPFGTALLNFLYAFLIDAALVAFACLISALVYKRSVSRQLETPKSSAAKKQKYETGGKISMFIRKDFKEIIRYPALAFYCLFEIIIGPVVMLVLGLNLGGMVTADIEEIGMSFAELMAQMPHIVALVLICFITFFVFATNYTATTAFTRENRNFYILKIIPMSYGKIIDAKAILSFIVNEIGVVLMVALALALIKVPLLSALITLVVCTVIGLVFSYAQVYMDLRNPRLNWDNISTGLKNNYASLFSLLLSFALIVVLIGLYWLFSLAGIEIMMYIYFVVVALLSTVAAVYARKVAVKNAAAMIENITL